PAPHYLVCRAVQNHLGKVQQEVGVSGPGRVRYDRRARIDAENRARSLSHHQADHVRAVRTIQGLRIVTPAVDGVRRLDAVDDLDLRLLEIAVRSVYRGVEYRKPACRYVDWLVRKPDPLHEDREPGDVPVVGGRRL